MKMYVCQPSAPRPFNVAMICNRVRDLEHAFDIVRLMRAINFPILDCVDETLTRIDVITSNDPNEPFTFLLAPDYMPHADVAAHFDCADD